MKAPDAPRAHPRRGHRRVRRARLRRRDDGPGRPGRRRQPALRRAHVRHQGEPVPRGARARARHACSTPSARRSADGRPAPANPTRTCTAASASPTSTCSRTAASCSRLMQAFMLGSRPGHRAAPPATASSRVYRLPPRRGAASTPSTTREFLADGMLINTMVGLRMADDYRPTTRRAASCSSRAFADQARLVLDAGQQLHAPTTLPRRHPAASCSSTSRRA